MTGIRLEKKVPFKKGLRSSLVLFIVLFLLLSAAAGCAPLFSSAMGDRDCLIYALELQARTPAGIPTKLLYAQGNGWAHYWLWLQIGDKVYIHDRDGSRLFGPLPDIDPYTIASWAVAPHRVEKADYVVNEMMAKK